MTHTQFPADGQRRADRSPQSFPAHYGAHHVLSRRISITLSMEPRQDWTGYDGTVLAHDLDDSLHRDIKRVR